MNFEELLITKRQRLTLCYDHKDTVLVDSANKKLHSVCKPIVYEFLEIHDLGKWALENLERIQRFTEKSSEEILLSEKETGEFSRKYFEMDFYFKIAIACFGEEEVKRRILHCSKEVK